MAATAAFLGFGTILKIGDGGGTEVFTEVAELLTLSGPSMSVGTVDATHTASPDTHREYLAGIADGGEISCSFNWKPTDTNGQAAALTRAQARTKGNWQIVFSNTDASVLAFSGIITGFAWETPLDGTVKLNLTIKVSGKPTLTV